MFPIVRRASSSSVWLKLFHNRKWTQKERPTRDVNSQPTAEHPPALSMGPSHLSGSCSESQPCWRGSSCYITATSRLGAIPLLAESQVLDSRLQRWKAQLSHVIGGPWPSPWAPGGHFSTGRMELLATVLPTPTQDYFDSEVQEGGVWPVGHIPQIRCPGCAQTKGGGLVCSSCSELGRYSPVSPHQPAIWGERWIQVKPSHE